ncbi:MAG: M23 family metallopeptidase [Desulfobacterales bacterium]|nr:M23 family metallopeptidase [Desulfobacterales bacterium]
MSKKITVFVFREHSARLQSLSVSTNRIVSLLCLLAAGLAVMTAYAIDYGNLKEAHGTAFNMRHKLTLQSDEISRQRRQIQFFASEINRLKSAVLAFDQFEKKIRIISNIEATPGSGSLFGIGGPIPADMEINVPVDESHDDLLREMHTQLKQVDEATMAQRKGFMALLDYLEDQRSLLSSTPSIWPTDGWISSGFGYRNSPFTGLREFHKGIDIAAVNGQAIFATGDGLITFAGPKGSMGKMIVIDHGHGMTTRYGHLKTLSKKQGNNLKRGEGIGFIGTSGRTTGPHLHYEVLVNGIPVKPRAYILD